MAIGTTAALIGGSLLGAGVTAYSASQSASAAEEAASTSADAQTAALNYLKEINALPQELKESALTQLASLYGLTGDSSTAQAELVSSIESSPFYESLVSSGEQAVLRNQAATGGLRSGNAQTALAESNQSVLQDLYNQQLSGLSSLAGLSTSESSIADLIESIGSTEASGITASAQSTQSGISDITNLLLNGLSSAISTGTI